MAPRTLCLIAMFTLLTACMHPRTIEASAEVQLTPLKTISTVKARLLLTTRKASTLQKIAKEKTISPELTAELKAAADQFKQTWKR